MGNSAINGTELGNTGTVTNFAFTNANGFTGTVSSATSAPQLSLQFNGERTLLREVNITGDVASVDFTSDITSQFRNYIVEFDNVFPATNSTDLLYRVSRNSGFTWDTVYVFETHGHEGATNSYILTASFGGTSCSLHATGWKIPNAANNPNTPASGHVYLVNPSNSSGFKRFRGQMHQGLSNGTAYSMFSWSSATNLTVGAVNGIQFYCSSGNLATGSFRLYGLN